MKNDYVIELEGSLENDDLEYEATAEPSSQSYDGELSIDIVVEEGEGATKDYNNLYNRPKINGWELVGGENTLTDIGVTQLVNESLGNVEALLAVI